LEKSKIPILNKIEVGVTMQQKSTSTFFKCIVWFHFAFDTFSECRFDVLFMSNLPTVWFPGKSSAF